MTRSPWVMRIDLRTVLALVADKGGRFSGTFFPLAVGSMATVVSRTTWLAGLSVRSPWKTACRIRPARVHSPNATSARSLG